MLKNITNIRLKDEIKRSEIRLETNCLNVAYTIKI